MPKRNRVSFLHFTPQQNAGCSPEFKVGSNCQPSPGETEYEIILTVRLECVWCGNY